VITGGAFLGGIAEDDPGTVGPSLLVAESASVEIRGGTFDGSWVIRGPDAVVEVFGHRLNLSALFSALSVQHFVEGELEDGSPLSVELILEDGAESPVIHELPEPSAVVGTLAWVRRRRC